MSDAMDDRIKLLLEKQGFVTPQMLSDLPESERATVLADYFARHRADMPLVMQADRIVLPGAAAAAGADVGTPVTPPPGPESAAGAPPPAAAYPAPELPTHPQANAYQQGQTAPPAQPPQNQPGGSPGPGQQTQPGQQYQPGQQGQQTPPGQQYPQGQQSQQVPPGQQQNPPGQQYQPVQPTPQQYPPGQPYQQYPAGGQNQQYQQYPQNPQYQQYPQNQPYQQQAYVKQPPRFSSPKGLSTALQLTFWLGIPVNLLVLVLILTQTINTSYRDANSAAGFINLIFAIWTVPMFVLLLIWAYRTSSNLRALNVGGLKFTPGMSVVWFIIPVANFFMPIRVMREINRGSDPQTAATNDASTTKAPFFTGLWFLAYILGGFIFLPATIMLSVGAATGGGFLLPPGLQHVSSTARGFLIGGSIARMLIYTIAIIGGALFVSKISKWQQQRGAQAGLIVK